MSMADLRRRRMCVALSLAGLPWLASAQSLDGEPAPVPDPQKPVIITVSLGYDERTDLLDIYSLLADAGFELKIDLKGGVNRLRRERGLAALPYGLIASKTARLAPLEFQTLREQLSVEARRFKGYVHWRLEQP